MNIRRREDGTSFSQAVPQPGRSSHAVDLNDIDALCPLMKIYASDQVLDEGESEVDLMIQLSGMVFNDLQSSR